jgi:hypothetical protein
MGGSMNRVIAIRLNGHKGYAIITVHCVPKVKGDVGCFIVSVPKNKITGVSKKELTAGVFWATEKLTRENGKYKTYETYTGVIK